MEHRLTDRLPAEYWGFDAVRRSFEAVGYGRMETIGGQRWRVRGGDYVLVSPPVAGQTLPAAANRTRSRSLVWCSVADGVPVIAAGKTYYVRSDWVMPVGIVPRALRKGRKELVRCDPGVEELRELLGDWVSDKKLQRPTSMVVRGHYASMIEDSDFRFVGHRSPDGGLVCAAGHASEGGSYVVSFAKHHYCSWWVAKFLWADALLRLLEDGAEEVICGDTADKLKVELGMTAARQYRVNFREGL